MNRADAAIEDFQQLNNLKKQWQHASTLQKSMVHYQGSHRLLHEYPTGITSLNYIKPSNKQSMTSAKSLLRGTKIPFWCRTCSISAIKRGLDHGPVSIRKDCTDQRAPNLLNAASHLEVLPNGSNWIQPWSKEHRTVAFPRPVPSH